MHVLVATDGRLDPAAVAKFAAPLTAADGRVTVLTVIEVPRALLSDLQDHFNDQRPRTLLRTDIETVIMAAPVDSTECTADVEIDSAPIAVTDDYLLRVRTPDGLAENGYDLCVSARSEDLTCEDIDLYEPPSRFRIDSTDDIPACAEYIRARLCGGDVDTFPVRIGTAPGVAGATWVQLLLSPVKLLQI